MTRSIDIQALIGLWKAREQVVPEVTLVNIEIRPGNRIETESNPTTTETEEQRATTPVVELQPPADLPQEGSPADATVAAVPTPLDEGFDEGIDDEGFQETPRVPHAANSDPQAVPSSGPLAVVHDAASPAPSSSVAAHSSNQPDADVRVDCSVECGPVSDMHTEPVLNSTGESHSAVNDKGQTEERPEEDITDGVFAETSAAGGNMDLSTMVALECSAAVLYQEPPVDILGPLQPRKKRFVGLPTRVFRRSDRAPRPEEPTPPCEPRGTAAGVSAESAADQDGTSGGASRWRRTGRKPGTTSAGKPMKLRKRNARKQAHSAEEDSRAGGDTSSTRQKAPANRQIPTIFLTSPEGAVTDCVPCTTPLAVDSIVAFDLGNTSGATEPYLTSEDFGSIDGGQSAGRPVTNTAQRGAARAMLGMPFATGFLAIWRLRKSSKRAHHSAV